MFGSTAALFGSLSLVMAAIIPDDKITTIIERDVVILGGGASGAHAAVRLREDLNKTIVVVEKQNRLGGHVATFTDPESGAPFDFGVNSYTDYTGAREFFARFNIPVKAPSRLALTTTYANFNTGGLSNYSLPSPTETTAALQAYLALCEKYESSILPSYADFPNTTTGIPEDLTLKFSDFVKKYSLEAAVPRIFQVTGLGMGNLAEQTTLYVMQAFGSPITRSFLGTVSSFVPASRRNQDLFDAIAELLHDDVLFSSTAVKTTRTDDGVQVVVRSDGDQFTLIRAKRLVISFEPTLNNLNGIDVDDQEIAVFSKWDWSTVYVGVVSHSSLPNGYSFTNVIPTHWLSLPGTPFVGRFDYLGDDNFRVLVTGDSNYNSCEAQKLVKKSLKLLASAGTIPDLGTESLKLKAWSDHGAMHLSVSGSDLKAGHITKQYALQGRKSTYYTGGAWSAQFTTILWEYNNQYLLPKLLAEF
ncbi:Beta-cyclopiazonate dehydrogenase 1 [Colletotrichum chlorophyti]|uniref:Beta-cyclopiazonate dehydrogenase 1 n=1 Tax=Colletotrichum chlorophyti TaxID=708187 RepID=A0A1Q8RXQ5_9PEZI|nr:Beta-cyclopiazonate dehydrogenase 1 [Colletotrichum chlorophyti]